MKELKTTSLKKITSLVSPAFSSYISENRDDFIDLSASIITIEIYQQSELTEKQIKEIFSIVLESIVYKTYKKYVECTDFLIKKYSKLILLLYKSRKLEDVFQLELQEIMFEEDC